MRGLLMFERGRVSRVAQRKRHKVFMYGILALVLAFSFFVLLGFVSRNEQFQVTKVSVSGNALVAQNEILTLAHSALSGAYWGVFPKRNYLLLPKREIISMLETEIPAIDSAEITRTSFSSINISVRERTPFVLWCSENAEIKDAETPCYFVDREGLIFLKAPDFSSEVYLRFAGQASSTRGIGGRLFSPERFREFSFFLQSLRDLGLSPQVVSLKEEAAGVSDYFIELASGAAFFINRRKKIFHKRCRHTRLFFSPEIATTSSRFLDRADYIDFRFENK